MDDRKTVARAACQELEKSGTGVISVVRAPVLALAASACSLCLPALLPQMAMSGEMTLPATLSMTLSSLLTPSPFAAGVPAMSLALLLESATLPMTSHCLRTLSLFAWFRSQLGLMALSWCALAVMQLTGMQLVAVLGLLASLTSWHLGKTDE